MRHLTVQQLSASLDEALIGVSLELVSRHLSACDECRASRERLAKLDATLIKLVDHVPDEEYLEDAALRIEAHIESEARGGGRTRAPLAPARTASSPRAGRVPVTPDVIHSAGPYSPAPRPRRLPNPALLAALAFVAAGGGIVALLPTLGTIRVPEFRVPDVRLPALRLPAFRLPEFRLPEFRLPERPPARRAEIARRPAETPAAQRAVAPAAVPPPTPSAERALTAGARPGDIAAVNAPRVLAEPVARMPAPPPAPAPATRVVEAKPAPARPKPAPARATEAPAVATSEPSVEKPPARAVAATPTPAQDASPPPAPAPTGSAAGIATTTKVLTVTAAPSPAPAVPAAPAPEERSEDWPLVCGEVADPAGEPIAGARVLLADLDLGARTDRRGRFCLSAPPGDRTLSVVALGFATHRRVISLAPTGLELSIRLEATP